MKSLTSVALNWSITTMGSVLCLVSKWSEWQLSWGTGGETDSMATPWSRQCHLKVDLTGSKCALQTLGQLLKLFSRSIIDTLRERRKWNHTECSIKMRKGRDFPGVRWLGPGASTAEGVGLIPGRGTKIPPGAAKGGKKKWEKAGRKWKTKKETRARNRKQIYVW